MPEEAERPTQQMEYGMTSGSVFLKCPTCNTRYLLSPSAARRVSAWLAQYAATIDNAFKKLWG